MRYVDELTGALKAQLALAYRTKDLIAYALRDQLREGYSSSDFRADARAALAVSSLGLPLSLALAVTLGVAPQAGIYSAVIAGITCALLGGSRAQVTGPTAAIVVVSLPILHKFGLGGLLVAGVLAGGMLVVMGLARMGRLLQFIPHPVTTGLTTGVAAVICTLQLRPFLGLPLAHDESALTAVAEVGRAIARTNGWEVLIGALTLGALLWAPRLTRRVPDTLLALGLISLLALALGALVPGFHVATIGTAFSSTVDGHVIHGIPPLPPLPLVPWHQAPGLHLSYEVMRELMPSAFAIAALGAIEALNTATMADGMSGKKHDPNAELIALGIANVVVPFFGGIAASGTVARTAANLRSGARSPLAAALQGVFVTAAVIVAAPLLGYVPLAALAALMLVLARDQSELLHFSRLLKIGQRSDVLVMMTCFALTVAFDMALAVTVGVVLAALLFMRRMAVLTKVVLDTHSTETYELPPGVRLYEVAGPLFFGAAKSAMDALASSGHSAGLLILSMKHVPTIDATGLVALESVLNRLQRSRTHVILAGLQAEVAELLERAGIRRVPGKLAIAPDVETAVSMAIVHSARGL